MSEENEPRELPIPEGGPKGPDQKPLKELDPFKVQMYLSEIRDNQNLGLGIIGGLGAALLGAIVWAAISYLTDYRVGALAIGIGFLVALAVRFTGRGIDISFRITAAVLALAGCAFGNLLIYSYWIAEETGLGIQEVLTGLDLELVTDIFSSTFTGYDIIFYALAVYAGYKYSAFQIPDNKLAELAKK